MNARQTIAEAAFDRAEDAANEASQKHDNALLAYRAGLLDEGTYLWRRAQHTQAQGAYDRAEAALLAAGGQTRTERAEAEVASAAAALDDAQAGYQRALEIFKGIK